MESLSSKGDVHEFVSMEVPTVVPMAPRSPRQNPTQTREVPKPKNDKQNKSMSVHESPRKYVTTHP